MNCARHIREKADPKSVKQKAELEEIAYILAGVDEGKDFPS